MLKKQRENNIRKPYFSLPGVSSATPDMHDILASMPKEREHRFESAGEFIKRLAFRVAKWRENVGENEVPVVLAFLPTGDAVEVLTIGEDGHSSVVIEGLVDGSPCMFISNQASLQVLCYTRVLEPDEEIEPRRMIGFHVGGEEIEA